MPITLAGSEPSRLDWHRHMLLAATAAPPASLPSRDADFMALQDAYREHGGMARGDDLSVSLALAGRGGFVELARRVVAGQLFSFRWHDSFWLPMFQFDPLSLALREAPRRVLDELHGVYDGWDMAQWHVHPHADLGGKRPLDLLETDLPAVLSAARSDRHAIDG